LRDRERARTGVSEDKWHRFAKNVPKIPGC